MDRMAKWAGRLYPRWWRERYGDEFEALLDDARPGIRGVLDIAKGALAMQLSTWSAKRVILFSATIGLLAGLVTAYSLKPKYASVAMIKVPSSLEIHDVGELQRQILGRSSLSHLVRDLGLYPEERRKMAPEDLLSMMRKDIYFVSPGPGYFVVRFLYPDSATAQRVVAEIVAEFQKANLVVTQSASRQNDPVFPNKTDLSIVGLIVGTALGSIAGLALFLNRRRRRTAQTGTPQ